jgi:hypothetical protein
MAFHLGQVKSEPFTDSLKDEKGIHATYDNGFLYYP